MPKSKTIPSGRTPSPRSPSRAATKSARRKRAAAGASAANSRQRASDAGSRSTAISSPPGPSRSAIRRACPPPPKVQSTKVSPGCGSRRSTSSSARTGSWSLGTYLRFAGDSAAVFVAAGYLDPTIRCVAVPEPISASSLVLGEVLRHIRDLLRHFLLVGVPALGAPDLEPVVRADDDAGSLPQAGVLDQLLGQADSPRRVQGVVEGAAVEVAPHHPALPAERIGLAEELLGEALVARGREHPDGGFESLSENDSIGQRRAEPRRDREAVLRVEVVLVLTQKRQSGV